MTACSSAKPTHERRAKSLHRVAIPAGELRGHVAAAVVGRLDREDLVAEGEQLLRRRRPAGVEALVGVDAHAGRMVEDDELQPIEVGDLAHRLGDLQDEMAVERGQLLGLDLDRFLRPRRAVAAVGLALADASRRRGSR